MKPTILDGALGTELERRGYRTRLPLWSASAIQEAPELIQKIHEEYIQAGADIITANTFRTTPYTYHRSGKDIQQAIDDTHRALDIAQAAVKQIGNPTKVAASISTLEDCYRPDLTPDLSTLKEFHAIQVDAIRSAGYEMILIETMHSITEAKIIAKNCWLAKMPYMISFIPGDRGKLLGGELLSTALATIKKYEPQAVLLNCRPYAQLKDNLDDLRKAECPIGIYANGSGAPDDEFGWNFDGEEDEKFVQNGLDLVAKGINIVGGCCGTTPSDIQQFVAKLHSS